MANGTLEREAVDKRNCEGCIHYDGIVYFIGRPKIKCIVEMGYFPDDGSFAEVCGSYQGKSKRQNDGTTRLGDEVKSVLQEIVSQDIKRIMQENTAREEQESLYKSPGGQR